MTDLQKLPANTPVIVGTGFFQQKIDDAKKSFEPYLLMVKAIRAAAVDAGSEALMTDANSIAVPQGMWQYTNPAQLIADQIGAEQAKTIFATIGVIQLKLISDACEAIQSGEQDIAIVTGGDAKYRTLRAKIDGVEISDTDQHGAQPDICLSSDDKMWADLESERGLYMPTEFFAIMESSLRKQQGLSIDENRDMIAKMYSDFSKVAEANPHSWQQKSFDAETIRNASDKNPMISFPYTKLHNSKWNVNQASALILCSVGKAIELGIDENKWVFPLSATQATQVVAMSQRPVIHSSYGTKVSATKAFELADLSPDDVDHIEIYSCFPSAVESFAIDSGLGLERPLTVTGGMPFAGGPLNNFNLQGLARLVEVLREDAGSIGLISALSGLLGKQSFSLYSTKPNKNGYKFEDVTVGANSDIAPP